MSIPAWEGNWRDDIIDAVKSLGFQSLNEYSTVRSSMTYEDLARELGEIAKRQFAPVQIEQLFREDARISDEVGQFVKSSFVRHLRCLMPNGWGVGDDWVFNFSHAIGAWSSRLPKKYVKQCEKLAKYLLRQKPVFGWLPMSADDALLERVFQESKFKLFPIHERHTGKE